MDRREFLKAAALATVGAGLRIAPGPKRTHLVTLSFDDGFKKSFYEVAAIHERFGLSACLNVIAQRSEPGFRPTVAGRDDAGIVPFPKGDWNDWNALKARGHEVMAHTYDHTDLTTIPLDEAKAHIDRCAAVFEARLKGFRASESVYNFAYNASTPALDAHALTRFLVVRTQGESPVNPIPTRRKPTRIGCWSHGPDRCEAFLDAEIDKFLASPGGWFVFNAHGLDGEGWGPMGAGYLEGLLSRLTRLPHVEVVPAGRVVRRLRR